MSVNSFALINIKYLLFVLDVLIIFTANNKFMTTVLLGIGFVAVFFILMSVRLLFIKGGQFKGTCASQSPFLNKEGGTCGYCGRNIDDGEACKKDEEKSEVEKFLSKF